MESLAISIVINIIMITFHYYYIIFFSPARFNMPADIKQCKISYSVISFFAARSTLYISSCLAPRSWSRVTETTRLNFTERLYVKRFPHGPSQS